VICERDPALALARDDRMLAATGGQVATQPRQELIPPITGGLLSASPHPANGCIFPQPRVRQGAETVLLDTVAGDGFRVVASDASLFDASASRDFDITRVLVTSGCSDGATQPSGAYVAVSEVDGVVAAWMQRHQCAAAIVRPDHYVFGVAASRAELDQQLGALRAALA
jgi:3-(3-hydroxy-phenyl)propionate hydroxylase